MPPPRHLTFPTRGRTTTHPKQTQTFRQAASSTLAFRLQRLFESTHASTLASSSSLVASALSRAPPARSASACPPRRRRQRRRRHRQRRRRRPLHRLCGASPSREAVTAQQAARQHSPTSYRAPRPPERRTTKRTARPTGSSGTRTATAAAGALPAGSSTPARLARPQPAIWTGTGVVATMPASTPATRLLLPRASPRGVHGAAGRGGTRR